MHRLNIFLTVLSMGALVIFDEALISTFLFESDTNGDLALTLSEGLAYLKIMLIGLIPYTISQVYASTLRETEHAVLPMVASIVAVFTNLILNYILIFGNLGFDPMGVEGAAIATVIVQFVAAVLGIIFNITLNKEIKLTIKNIVPEKELIRDILIIGIPSVLMQAIGSVMTFSMNTILKGFGLSALNIFGIYFKLQSFIFMPIFGLNNAMVPIVSYNYGAEVDLQWSVDDETVAKVENGIMILSRVTE